MSHVKLLVVFGGSRLRVAGSGDVYLTREAASVSFFFVCEATFMHEIWMHKVTGRICPGDLACEPLGRTVSSNFRHAPTGPQSKPGDW